jgi:hypothetical protein
MLDDNAICASPPDKPEVAVLRTIAFATAVLAMLIEPVVAQEGNDEEFVMPTFTGVAVAQAPEAGLGVCFSETAEEGMLCARQQCMEESGLGLEDCAVNLWCYPHGWVVQLAVMHNEGIHWAKIICDEMSREDMDKAVAAYCDNEMFADCIPMRIWDPDGAVILDYPKD